MVIRSVETAVARTRFGTYDYDNAKHNNMLQSSETVQTGNAEHRIINLYIEKKLEMRLKLDKGTGCEMPKLDPFSPEIIQFDKNITKVVCHGNDWVKCNISECRLVEQLFENPENVICRYEELLHMSDSKYYLARGRLVQGNATYTLRHNDYARVSCESSKNKTFAWHGYAIGLRRTTIPSPPKDREKTYNVLIIGLDSTAKNGFIRRMPQSLKVLTEEFQAVILNGYNVLGDGTPAALFPILTGRTELELPEARQGKSNISMDIMPFIFYKLKEDGYRTAYLEDSPSIGTFQMRFNGFRRRPADHYLRSLYMDVPQFVNNSPYCLGDTPQYKVMLDITKQFFQLDGKRFCFTFIADISHDDVNMITTADDDLAEFLRQFKDQGHLNNTLLFVMGDHGPRYASQRNTYQGKLEERLPFMAVVLPEELKETRPSAQQALEQNAEVLTTPHDIHATILDVIDMRQYWNNYTVTGADYTRALTLLEPITRNRSCSEAGIESHWCACLKWTQIPEKHPLYYKAAQGLVDHINSLTQEARSDCFLMKLSAVHYVMSENINDEVLRFHRAADTDGYVGQFIEPNFEKYADNYQVKISVTPGLGIYEALVMHLKKQDKFVVNTREISRINAYGNTSICIRHTKPHLNMFCYCRKPKQTTEEDFLKYPFMADQ